MSTLILRRGVEVENPLELVLEFLAAYSSYEAYDSSGPASFDENDLRLANRGGARISAAEIAAILERRGEIERGLHAPPRLSAATNEIWIATARSCTRSSKSSRAARTHSRRCESSTF